MPETRTPTIPLTFQWFSESLGEGHLEVQRLDDHFILRWPLIGAHVILAKDESYYDIRSAEALNADTFKNWDFSGFSLGDYHEFACNELESHVTFFISGAEVSFGYATPLFATLYGAYHDEHFFEWDNLTTVRILKAERDQVEAIFINASLAYSNKFAVLPRVICLVFDYGLLEKSEEQQSPAAAHRLPPAVADLTALRFHYNGLVQIDSAAACLYFYRVVEYFAFLTYHKEIGSLRHNASLSDVDFTKRVMEIISTRDEKGPILRLVNQVADDSMLVKAIAAGILNSKDASVLGSQLYSFRNAIVHGKHAGGYVPETSSVISGDSTADRWRPVLQALSDTIAGSQ